MANKKKVQSVNSIPNDGNVVEDNSTATQELIVEASAEKTLKSKSVKTTGEKKVMNNVTGSVGAALLKVKNSINTASSRAQLRAVCANAVKDCKDGAAFLKEFDSKKDITSAIRFVWNYIIAGEGLKVL